MNNVAAEIIVGFNEHNYANPFFFTFIVVFQKNSNAQKYKKIYVG